MKLLQDSKGGILSKETLSNAIQAVMSEYQKYLMNEDGTFKEMNEETFNEFLNTEAGKQVIEEQLNIILDEMFKNLDFKPEQLSEMEMAIIKGYIEYAQKNDLPDPSKFEESFSTFLQSEKGQVLVQESVKNTITNYADLEKQLTNIYDVVAKDVGSSIADVMKIITTNIDI